MPAIAFMFKNQSDDISENFTLLSCEKYFFLRTALTNVYQPNDTLTEYYKINVYLNILKNKGKHLLNLLYGE